MTCGNRSDEVIRLSCFFARFLLVWQNNGIDDFILALAKMYTVVKVKTVVFTRLHSCSLAALYTACCSKYICLFTAFLFSVIVFCPLLISFELKKSVSSLRLFPCSLNHHFHVKFIGMITLFDAQQRHKIYKFTRKHLQMLFIRHKFSVEIYNMKYGNEWVGRKSY